MIIYGIYSNIQNKYIYIGQTNNFSRRKDEHYFTGHLDIDKLIQNNPTQYFNFGLTIMILIITV